MPRPPRYASMLRWICSALLACLALPGAAIQPQRWVHSTEADFEPGTFDGVVVTNLGDLKLASAAEPTAELPDGVSVIYDTAVVGDTLVVAAGPEGKLLAIDDGEAVELMVFEDRQVFSLLATPNTSVFTAAVSGAESSLLTLNLDTGGDQPEASILKEVALPEVDYVWDLATRPGDTTLLLATGGEGKVLGVGPNDTAETLLDTAQANVLCLAVGPDGVVYAGTDTDGLVYRLDADGTAFVVYDAAEPEIGALLVAGDGSVYLGTADADQARPGRLENAAGEAGRPDADQAAIPVEVEPIDPPDLPVEPDPTPMNAPAEAAAAETDEIAGPPTTDTSETNADEDPGDAAATPTTPTAEQYDRLRDEVRRRLLAARETGAMPAGNGRPAAADRPTRRAAPAAAADKSGNAVYRLDPHGFVSEVFRESVMVLSLAEDNSGRLLVGTGSEGQLYRVDPAAGEVAVLNDLEPQQLLALRPTDAGLLVGGSNPAALLSLTGDTADTGTFTSQPLDAGQVSLWGRFRLTADLPPGSSASVRFRAGNVADPEIAAWSAWTDPIDVTPDDDHPPLAPHELEVAAPPARFLQYEVTLESDAAEATPLVGKIELAYVTPNLRPAVASLTAAYPDFAGVDQPASTTMNLAWSATDDNGDRLLYDLHFRPAGASDWLHLAEDLTDTSFAWETRSVPDGRYELRVTADDRLDNPGDMALTAARRADPVLVDNTPPTLTLDGSVGDGSAELRGEAADAFSTIRSVAYALDNADEYVPVLPDDLIYDSTREAWSVTLSDLAPGGHVVTVRVLDDRGNAAFASRLFEVE
ncbi:MAG: hypothetical protein AAF800_06570 [Planctomycetota bacterium]